MIQNRMLGKDTRAVSLKHGFFAVINPSRVGFWLLACTICCFSVLSPACAEILVVKKAVIAFSDSAGNQAALVRADRAFQDHERIGFFSIGLLPLVIFENVQIEFLKPGEFSESMQHIKMHFARLAGAKAVEIRDVSLRFSGDNEPRLRAKLVRSISDGVWKLQSGIAIDCGQSYEFERATLNTSGPRAGSITFTSGTISKTINWFESASLQPGRGERTPIENP
jgi:hypothetical protein